MRTTLVPALALLALACSPHEEPTPEELPIAETGPDREMDWPQDTTPCGQEARCFFVEAPLDRNDPEGESVSIHTVLLPSTSDEPDGVLLVNYGGFGAPGTPMLEGWAASMPELRERYHLVSWDPRGAGQSEALECGRALDPVFDATGPAEDLEAVEAQIEARASIIDACRATHGAMIDHMGFQAHASDLEAIRAELGVEEFDYLGYSGGTALGQTYAHLYGEHVGHMALDSIMPAQGGARRLMSYQAPEVAVAIEEFQRWCDGSNCGIEDADATLRELLQRATDGTLRAGLLGGPVRWNDAAHGIIFALYSTGGYPVLARYLDQAQAGDATGLQSLGHAYFGRNELQNASAWHTVYHLTNCAGEVEVTTPQDVLAAHEAYERYSDLAPVYANDHTWCAAIGEGVDPIREVQTAPDVRTPILILQSTVDFATPLRAAEDMAAELDDSRLVVFEGSGHISSFHSACMRQYLVDYLVNEVVPPEGSFCSL